MSDGVLYNADLGKNYTATSIDADGTAHFDTSGVGGAAFNNDVTVTANGVITITPKNGTSDSYTLYPETTSANKNISYIQTTASGYSQPVFSATTDPTQSAKNDLISDYVSLPALNTAFNNVKASATPENIAAYNQAIANFKNGLSSLPSSSVPQSFLDFANSH